MSSTVSIVIVDDHPIFRTGLAQVLRTEPDFVVVGEGGSGQDALELVRSLAPDLLLLDVSMSDSGIDRIGDILKVHPETRIVMLTASRNDDDIARTLEAGVSGYVLKGTSGRELIDILRAVCNGQTYISPQAMNGLWAALKAGPDHEAQKNHVSSLSRQEVQVLRLVAVGLNNREIGNRLGVTEKTVKFHLSNVFSKLSVRNRVEASIMARRVWHDIES